MSTTQSNPPETSIDELFNSLSIVMITLNEEAAVATVVNDIRRVAKNAEIIIVDSSTDKTAEIASEMGCTVIKQFPPRGYGNAMHMALQSATKKYVLTLDCDNTYPVDVIPDLLNLMIKEKADIVSASRLGKRPAAMPLANYYANVLFCVLARIICGVHSTDLHTGMRVYTQDVLHSYSYDPSYGALPVELQVGPVMAGYKCVETFIEYNERAGVSKLRKIEGTITTLQRIWTCRRFANPAHPKNSLAKN